MGAVAATTSSGPSIQHTPAYRFRRFLNWFPMGLTYAFLYMGRYNLTVAKTSLSQKLMTNEDFGVIFAVGTVVYALAFLFNGPLIDRIGGKKGIVLAAGGATVANLLMGFYLRHVLLTNTGNGADLRLVFCALYGLNMYFQSFGAVSIVKVNAHWFHVSERGGFSGIFGTMIASGIFLAFTVNGWLLDLAAAVWGKDSPTQWIVFFAPAALLGLFTVIEAVLLRDRPSQVGHQDFDTGDASSGEDEKPVPTLEIFRRLFTNPVMLTIACIEFCTGVLRNGVMHWFPIYASGVWALPKDHVLRDSVMVQEGYLKAHLPHLFAIFGAAALLGFLASRMKGTARAWLIIAAAAIAMAPFLLGGWGGLLFVAGVVGGNFAGWVSDLFFQSRRAPAAGGLYAFLALCAAGMIFTLSPPTAEVASADAKSGLLPGDRIVAIAGREVSGWADVRNAVTCWPARCEGSRWDAKECVCSTSAAVDGAAPSPDKTIPARVVRGGAEQTLSLPDPRPVQRAGDARSLKAQPVLPMSPFVLGAIVFLVSVCVIGTHGLLSGTATMDFGGRKAAATAAGMIDGFVYLGTALQSVSLGFITSRNWAWWPPFLVPFAIIGFMLCLRIWNAKPKAAAAKAADAEKAAA